MSLDICKTCSKRSAAAKHLGDDELESLRHSCVEVTFAKGDIIFKQNALSSNIIYIRSGLVKVHITGPEREQIMKIAKGPTYLGVPTTVGDKINNYSATALSETNVCFIDISVFKRFLATNNDFSYEIIIDLCKNELGHFQRCVNQLQKHSPGRVAEALLFFSDEIFEKNKFILPLDRNEFGDLTGNSRENVSRILSDFNRDKLIRLNGKEIEILNMKLLRQVSKNG
ncbi:MAG: Crp/Fnr family transcriptional regulator [Mariniphaga sp.]|nr:Crp/Fnr family transcriptional regulator [Mariniphaga sp.]